MESEDEWPTSAEQFLRTRKVLSEVSRVGLGGERVCSRHEQQRLESLKRAVRKLSALAALPDSCQDTLAFKKGSPGSPQDPRVSHPSPSLWK